MSLWVLVVLLFVGGGISWWVYSVYSFNPAVKADEVHTVTTPDLWHLRVCRYKPEEGAGEPVLMVHGFMSTQFNFSAPAGASMADALREAGYDCWLIDLRGNRSSIPPFGHSLGDADIDDYLLRDIPSTIRYIQKVTGYQKVHWVGHSMGGMLLYAHDAVSGSPDLASGTTLGSPIGFQDVPFHRPGLAFALRKSSALAFRCGQRLLVSICHFFKPQLALLPINYSNMSLLVDAPTMFSALDAPPLGVTESMAKAAETHTWRVNDETIDVFEHLQDLKVPLFALFGEADPFVPVVHAEAFFNGIRNADKRLLVLSKANGHAADYSHVDLVFGREAKKDVFTPVIEWLRAHAIARHAVVAQEAARMPSEAAAAIAEAPKPKKRAAARKIAPAAAAPAPKAAAGKKTPKKKTPAKKAAVSSEAKPAKKTAAQRKPAGKKTAATNGGAHEAKLAKKPVTRKYASSKDRF